MWLVPTNSASGQRAYLRPQSRITKLARRECDSGRAWLAAYLATLPVVPLTVTDLKLDKKTAPFTQGNVGRVNPDCASGNGFTLANALRVTSSFRHDLE